MSNGIFDGISDDVDFTIKSSDLKNLQDVKYIDFYNTDLFSLAGGEQYGKYIIYTMSETEYNVMVDKQKQKTHRLTNYGKNFRVNEISLDIYEYPVYGREGYTENDYALNCDVDGKCTRAGDLFGIFRYGLTDPIFDTINQGKGVYMSYVDVRWKNDSYERQFEINLDEIPTAQKLHYDENYDITSLGECLGLGYACDPIKYEYSLTPDTKIKSEPNANTLTNWINLCFKILPEYLDSKVVMPYVYIDKINNKTFIEYFKETMNNFTSKFLSFLANVYVDPQKHYNTQSIFAQEGKDGVDRVSYTCYAKIIKNSSKQKYIIFGDFHASLHTLLRSLLRLRIQGHIQDDYKLSDGYNIIFLGDLIDRGNYGMEIILTIMRLFIKNPDKVHICKGNHEQLRYNYSHWSNWDENPKNHESSFYMEIFHKCEKNKDDARKLYLTTMMMFNYLPLAILLKVKEKYVIFCHGGVPYDILKNIGDNAEYINIKEDCDNDNEYKYIFTDFNNINIDDYEISTSRKIMNRSFYENNPKLHAIIRGHQDTLKNTKLLLKKNNLSVANGNVKSLMSKYTLFGILQHVNIDVNNAKKVIDDINITLATNINEHLVFTKQDARLQKQIPKITKKLQSSLGLSSADFQKMKPNEKQKEIDKQVDTLAREYVTEDIMQNIIDPITSPQDWEKLIRNETITDKYYELPNEGDNYAIKFIINNDNHKNNTEYYPVFTLTTATSSRFLDADSYAILNVE